jgi:hypothetical protein
MQPALIEWVPQFRRSGPRVRHAQGGFEWFFEMRSEKWTPLTQALNDNVSAQLTENGAQILSQSGDPRNGFHFEYKLGKSIGTLTISPLAITPPSSIHRGVQLPSGTVEVTAEIQAAEKWFPKEPGEPGAVQELK